jgi:lysophospholipase L1-like esterase
VEATGAIGTIRRVRAATVAAAAVTVLAVFALVVAGGGSARSAVYAQAAPSSTSTSIDAPGSVGLPSLASQVLPLAPVPTTMPPWPTTTTTTAPPPPPPPPPPLPRNPPLKVMVIGDSVAQTAALGLTAPGAANGITIQNEGIYGCGVVRGGPFRYFGKQYDPLPRCEAWVDEWSAAVDRDRPDVAMIVVGRWELMDRVHDGRWTHVGDPAFDAYLRTEFEQAITVVSAKGAKVALATTPYYHRGDRPDGGTWPEDEPARVDRVNQLLREVAAKHPGLVTLVDFGGHLSPDGHLAMQIDGVKVRTDGVHLSVDAGAWMAPWLLPQLNAIVPAQ